MTHTTSVEGRCVAVEKRQIEGRDFCFSIERPYQPDPDTEDLKEAPGYYVAFSVREPRDTLDEEIVLETGFLNIEQGKLRGAHD